MARSSFGASLRGGLSGGGQGAAAGAKIGGPKGALIGGLLGAGAGAFSSYFASKQDEPFEKAELENVRMANKMNRFSFADMEEERGLRFDRKAGRERFANRVGKMMSIRRSFGA